MQNHLFRYWGKADEKYVGATSWHPLAYHCLDVSSVAVSWWDASPTVQRTFLASFNYPEPQHLRAGGAFFVALHDLGKFDVRFQLKAPDALAAAWRPLGTRDHGLSKKDIAEFDHGDFYAPRMPGLILDTNEAIIDHDRNADGLWPHPHGARTAILVDGGLKWKFSAFRATSPAWTQLSEFVVPRGVNDPNVREGSEPSGPVAQADELGEG